MLFVALLALLGCGRVHYDRDAGASSATDAGEAVTLRCCGACTCTEPVCRIECTCDACDMRCPTGSTCMGACASGTCAINCALGSICALECGPSNLCTAPGGIPTWLGCEAGTCSR